MDVPILGLIRDGETVPIQPCNCGSCNNEWFVPAYSEEWHPGYCPYCGIKFLRKTVGDDEHPDDFLPFWNGGDQC